jgi:hypothetical protein
VPLVGGQQSEKWHLPHIHSQLKSPASYSAYKMTPRFGDAVPVHDSGQVRSRQT